MKLAARVLVLDTNIVLDLLVFHDPATEPLQRALADGRLRWIATAPSAFYLKLSEVVLLDTPGHLPLAAAVAAGFTQYAYAFVQFEADRIEARDAQAAQKLRERAARLYQRAQRHALRALELHRPGFAKALANRTQADGLRLSPEEVKVAYWAAAAWGGQIALSKDQPDRVADLPVAVRLASLAYKAAPRRSGAGR